MTATATINDVDVHFTEDIEVYASAASDYLERDPVRCTVPLTVIANSRALGPADGEVYSWVTDDEQTVGTASITPPHALLLSVMSDAAATAVAEAWSALVPPPHGVVGPRAATSACAEHLARRLGGTKTEGFPQRLFRLDRVDVPQQPSGAARRAETTDAELAVRWYDEFAREAGVPPTPDPRRAVAAPIAEGRLWLWIDDNDEGDHEVVSLAGSARSVAGVTRVAPVYTPKERRGRGYARALVAALSQSRLDAGDVCCLFTDLTNPVSNAIYEEIGYRQVDDFAQFDLTD